MTKKVSTAYLVGHKYLSRLKLQTNRRTVGQADIENKNNIPAIVRLENNTNFTLRRISCDLLKFFGYSNMICYI